jgi:hypothetical protein
MNKTKLPGSGILKKEAQKFGCYGDDLSRCHDAEILARKLYNAGSNQSYTGAFPPTCVTVYIYVYIKGFFAN